MENTALIKQFITALDSSAAALSPSITQLVSKSFEDRINEAHGDPLEQLTIANGYAYIVVSLCFAYLKSQGVNTNTHPIMKDLQRVKSYMNRAKQAAEGKTSDVKVDTEVAKRFIKSVLGSGQQEPAISQENFKGKHTRFEDKEDEEETETTEAKEKKVNDEIRNKLREKLLKKKAHKEGSKKDKVSKKKSK